VIQPRVCFPFFLQDRLKHGYRAIEPKLPGQHDKRFYMRDIVVKSLLRGKYNAYVVRKTFREFFQSFPRYTKVCIKSLAREFSRFLAENMEGSLEVRYQRLNNIFSPAELCQKFFILNTGRKLLHGRQYCFFRPKRLPQLVLQHTAKNFRSIVR